ncbi:MAG: lipopolysaccharide kinase InaA family protein [Verrucomicrobiota bacterium]
MIPVSPHHQIDLAPQYLPLIEDPPEQDQIIHTLMRKMANNQPLIQGDLVIAGADTRKQYPRAEKFPVHFRKSYYPTCFHQHPDKEFEKHLLASKIIGVPEPIGTTRTSFRSCFIPGRPLPRLSPFGAEPLESNITVAQESTATQLIALWKLLEELHTKTTKLHDNGLAHGDLFLHNVIVALTPIEVCLIDFELSVKKDDVEEEKWLATCQADLSEMLREAIYIQCGLGPQAGPLADASRDALPTLFAKTALHRFHRALDSPTNPR